MLKRQPWKKGSGTVEDVRNIFCEFYEEADRQKPDYFPAEQPAKKKHDTGRIKWQRDIQGGRVTFESEPDGINADFERGDWEVYDFEKRLPKRFMSDKSGTSVYIGAPQEFAEWVGYSVEELLNSPDQTNETYDDTTEREEEEKDDERESTGIISRLLGHN